MDDSLLDPVSRLLTLREAALSLLGGEPVHAAQRLADFVVPRFADWCAVDRLEADGSIARMAVAHQNPEKVAFVRSLEERYPPDPNAPHGVPQVLRTGNAELVSEIPEEMLVNGAVDAEHLRIIRELGLRAYVVLPLVVDGNVHGALTLVQAESGRSIGERHLPCLEDVALLAALAIRQETLAESRRRAHEKSREQAHLLGEFLDNLPDPAWRCRPDGGVLRYNRRWFEFSGMDEEEALGRGWAKALDPAMTDEVSRKWKVCLADGVPFQMECRLKGADGHYHWFLVRTRPIRDAQGVVTGWIGTGTDTDALNSAAALVTAVTEQSAEALDAIAFLRKEKEDADKRVAELEAELEARGA